MTIDVLAPFRLDGRVAIVTGASSGLGARFAQVLHAAGATVVLAARRADRLDALVAELGERAHAVECDVTVDADCRRLVDEAVAVGGGLDVLVNNAGTTYPGPAETEPPDEFRRVIDVNLTSVFVLSQLAFEPLRASGHGSIVNIASVLGLVASTPIKQASYTASKGGVVNLTRELGVPVGAQGRARERPRPRLVPERDDRCTCGATTPPSASSARNAPLGREGRDHELDGALLFLASDASSYVVGHTLLVDGGWTAR